jgi:hypothetical protein
MHDGDASGKEKPSKGWSSALLEYSRDGVLPYLTAMPLARRSSRQALKDKTKGNRLSRKPLSWCWTNSVSDRIAGQVE